jgi:nucleotide-binding universal stress UspA family protein
VVRSSAASDVYKRQELIVLNIGLKFGVISPLLFTMLVIMALVTTFMTSPLLEWIYPKRLIRLNTTEPETASTEKLVPDYKILVPVANPNSQAGLLQLASAITGEKAAVVHPLSLIELEEDYLYQSTPEAADKLITKRRNSIEAVISSIQPESVRKNIVPIVGISQDVARETCYVATDEQANLILVGWHRSAFTENSLGGRVGQILSNSLTDVAVFVDKKPYPWKSLVVAYANNIHDDLALSLGIRMLLSDGERQLKIIQFAQKDPATEGISSELWQSIETLPQTVRSRIEIAAVEKGDPLQAVIQASVAADLTIVGTSHKWGIERQTLGRYTDKLAKECESSILITRKYNEVAYQLNSLIEQESDNLSAI